MKLDKSHAAGTRFRRSSDGAVFEAIEEIEAGALARDSSIRCRTVGAFDAFGDPTCSEIWQDVGALELMPAAAEEPAKKKKPVA